LIKSCFQILELDRRRSEELGRQLDAVEFLALLLGGIRAAAKIFDAVALEAVGLVLMVRLLIIGKAGAGNVEQCILLAAVDRKVIVAALAGVDKLEIDVLADAFKVAIVPGLEGKCGGGAPAFFGSPFIEAAGGMGFNVVSWPESDVDVPAVGLPSRLAGRKMLVGVGDAPVMLFPVLVLWRIRVGVPALPESLNKGVALFVVAQAFFSSSEII
jgi:hypothetical protein